MVTIAAPAGFVLNEASHSGLTGAVGKLGTIERNAIPAPADLVREHGPVVSIIEQHPLRMRDAPK